ncbi:MAG: hypothetical protein ACREB3_08760, partial [Burkholderiales bacterium]
QSYRAAGAACAARALLACRTWAKICLVTYIEIPSKLWRHAYLTHSRAELGGCATTPVHLRQNRKAATTATHELLRLLMLRVSAPEMMAPAQIESATRLTEQMGDGFTLRDRGSTDLPFCFDPDGERPPQRATADAADRAGRRFFGPGTELESLAKLHKQLTSIKVEEIKIFGKDISPRAQLTTVEHLLLFWSAKSPYAPPAHKPASGELRVIHGFNQIWHSINQHKDSPDVGIASTEPIRPPEMWVVSDAGSNEIGVAVPNTAGRWPCSGKLIGVMTPKGGEWWIGLIRRMKAESATKVHADFAVLSREPVSVILRTKEITNGAGADWDSAVSELASDSITAILLPDISQSLPAPILLMPTEGWNLGRVYEAMLPEGPRFIRIVRIQKRGEDYDRVAFEWISEPENH